MEETIYRKVEVSERNPETRKIVFILHDADKWESTGYIDKKGRFFNDWDEDDIECFPSHWLEEIDLTQLKKDKEEILKSLSDSLKVIEWYMDNTMPESSDHTDFFNIGMNQRSEIDSLIQKHKQ